jgi:hypothetical protein
LIKFAQNEPPSTAEFLIRLARRYHRGKYDRHD